MTLRVSPLPARRLDELTDARFDAALVSVGCEQRSSALARHLGDLPGRAVAVEFEFGRTEVFWDNREFYDQAGWDLSEEFGEPFQDFAIAFFEQLRGKHTVVDVSSMTRWRIASVIASLAELEPDSDMSVDLLYLPAVCADPPPPPAAVLRLRPTSPFFAGSMDAIGATTCVIGLGYEPEKAAGTIETLEPSKVVAFVPHDSDGKYLEKVEYANRGLLAGRLAVERVDYDVADPYNCFVLVDQFVHDLVADGKRPALVPMGPKIFATTCLLVGARHQDDVSVWRASFRGAEDPVDHLADGSVYGLRVTIGDGPATSPTSR